MRLLVLSDIHANLEALEAVLRQAPAHDAVLCLGDVVGYGPNPNECVERVRGLPCLTVLVGNHDLAALGELDLNMFNYVAQVAAAWTARALSPPSRDFLGSLQATSGSEDYFAAHASPRDPIWEYLERPVQALASFRLFSQPVCFVGHTHVPRVFEENSTSGSFTSPAREGLRVSVTGRPRLILNPGGVGQPRDGDPRAAYGFWDASEGWFEFKRAPYAVDVTQNKIRVAGLPSQLADRLAAGA